MKLPKKLLSFALSLSLVLGLLPTAALANAKEMPFEDVTQSDWFYESACYVYEHGLMNGTSETTFTPNATTTRGMIVTMLHRLEKEPAATAAAFDDVPADMYCAAAVAWASANGIVSGYGNGKFGPDDPVTREQIAAIFYRYASYKEYGVTANRDLSGFTDANKVSDFARIPMEWANGVSLINGKTTTTLAPKDGATRAEVATILMRLCQDIVTDVQKPAETPASTPVPVPSERPSHPDNEGGGPVHHVMYYTVAFDANGGTASRDEILVEEGHAIGALPTADKVGYIFQGWYTAKTGGTKITASAPIMSHITLYAQWTAIENGTYQITFASNDGKSDVYQVQQKNTGEKVVKPAEDPTRELYRFTGWYMEPAAVTEYDFNTPVVSDLTLYAGWGNPDGTDDDGLYAGTDELDTIYSVTDICVDGSNTTVTYNVNSQCLIVTEFFADHMSGSDWSEDAMNRNLAEEPIATAGAYTAAYGELATVDLLTPENLPEYYVVRATLYGTGKDEAPTYVSNRYTEKYQNFEAQTVEDMVEKYGEDRVLNFDNNHKTNYGVLKDTVKIVPSEVFADRFEVVEVDVPGEAIPDISLVFTDASDEIKALNVGDIVYLEGTTWLFKIKTIDTDGNKLTMTQDDDVVMADFYDILKVDMAGKDQNADADVSEDTPELMWDIIDVDASLSASFNPSISKKFSNGITLTGKITGKVTGNVKMSYDAHLFSKDYFECAATFKTEIGADAEASMSTDNTNEWKNVVYQFDTRGIKLPTPVTGLNVYAKPSAKFDWSLSGNVGIHLNTNQTSGFKYNSDTGRTDIKKKQSTVSLTAEGKAEAKFGPNIDIGVELLGGVLNAGINAEAGGKFTAKAQTGADDFLDNVDSKHACGLCVSGEAKWYATAAVKCGYKITGSLKGSIANLTILNIEQPIYFLPDVPAKFFVSVLNSADSPFGGRLKFGGGSCTNKTYRTELQVLDQDGQQVNGVSVTTVKQGSTTNHSGDSPYVTYLYSGIYQASASVNGQNISKTFVVNTDRQIVTLSEASADGKLEGIVVDSADNSVTIADALIRVSKDGLVIGTAKSGSDGKFSIPVPEGTLQVDISKANYTSFSSTQTLYNGEVKYMGMIELNAGTGMGGFRGVIRDATDNTPLDGVELNLYKGWNSTTGANTAIRTLITNSNGEFRCETRTLFGHVLGIPSGNYTLTASKDGYADTNYNIIVYPGTTDENPVIEETMSEIMNEGFYRIILTWNETPRDLDSHFVADADTGSQVHVYFSNRDPSPNYANLDVDDTNSYGPETITITNFEGLSHIRYAVHDYTNRHSSDSDSMSYSGAKVRIYKGSHLLRTFLVPTGYGGTEWDVFKMDARGNITTVNDMKYTESPSDVLNFANGVSAFSTESDEYLKDYELTEASSVVVPDKDAA